MSASGGKPAASQGPMPVPSLAFLLSAFLPAFAAVARIAFEGRLGATALLIWLTGLVPVFLLTRYLGWRGSLIGLAWTSAMIILAELFASLLRGEPPTWTFVGIVVVATASVAFGAGLERQWWARRSDATGLADSASTGRVEPIPSGEVLDFLLHKLFEAARRKPPLAIVVFEVDRVEEYAELYGRGRAEKAIDVALQALSTQTRASNVCGRLDERTLVAFLNGERPQSAHAFAVRVIEELASLPAPWTGRITMSAGIAAFDPAMSTPEALKSQARRALGVARGMGGGIVVVAEPPGETLVTPGMVVLKPNGQVREIRGTV